MISIVIPVYNEEKNVSELHRELAEVLRKLGQPFEIIFVNDGSTDQTLENLKKLRPVKVINFRKRFGQTAAFDAGFKAVKGDLVITLDGDLQNDPHDIPDLLEELKKGYDVVCGWRFQRKDSLMKRFYSWGARKIRGFLLNDKIHDAGCSLRAYRREAVENLDIYGEMHRFIPSILALRGFKVTEIKVSHRPRQHGQTKYKWQRAIKGFVDMINVWFSYRYRTRPLHLFGGLGLLLIAVGGILTAYFIFIRLILGSPLAGRVLPIGALFTALFGIQLFVTGILADMAMKNYYANSKEKSYLVKEIIEL